MSTCVIASRDAVQITAPHGSSSRCRPAYLLRASCCARNSRNWRNASPRTLVALVLARCVLAVATLACRQSKCAAELKSAAVRMLSAMDPDDAAELVDELGAEKAEKLLKLMGVEDAKAIRQLLGYRDAKVTEALASTR